MSTTKLQSKPALIMACCILHNIGIDNIDIIDECLVLWNNHDEGYTKLLDHTTPEDKARQSQLVIEKHLYVFEIICFNK